MILHTSGMANYRSVQNPAKTSKSSGLSDHNHDPSFYRKLIGYLQYLTLTRPNITYVVNQSCQTMHQPTQSSIQELKRVLRYLQGIVSLNLPIIHGSLELTAFADAHWASDPADRKSTTGYCIFLGFILIP
ncbi:uncharacterized protein LOC110020555 [Phalaenopsis equestris]|uniref:uncharacterized protein LOC110020555 n=1 Tax=Phalaenopsis equestris TaxID=78828 RepID=UPI0009E5DF6A|nr:uncharacterized protein LOC110020555 [Phalaenopsis equestris]